MHYNCEVFYLSQQQIDMDYRDSATGETGYTPGFYWWYCQPGCLPDSEPFGPFDTQELAEEAAAQDSEASEQYDLYRYCDSH